MRKPVIAGNWKMYKLLEQAVETALSLKTLLADTHHCEVIIAPVFVDLKTVADRLQGSNIKVAGQNCSTEQKHGAWTGEIAADMLKDVGCSHVLIGHSERRRFYDETNESVNKKTKAALQTGLTAIVFVGETLRERESGKLFETVERQLHEGSEGIKTSDMKDIIIAYEPVWAIGTGKTATPEQAQEMHRFIRRILTQTHGKESAESVRILYGGSVKPNNIKDLMAKTDIDGAVVGIASLEADTFAKIVHYQ